MGIFSGGAPKAPPIPVAPPAAAPATLASSQVQTAGGSSVRQRAATAASSTLATSPQGLTDKPKTAGLTLLGATK